MKEPLRILMLEDSPADAELILETLEDGGVACDVDRVETREDFLAALERERFDLVLSDGSLPSFDGFTALRIMRAKLPDTPFILVSGTIGEEFAIETMKSGATDYVLKHRLSRLAPAVARAVAEARERRARKDAEIQRSETEALFRVLFDQLAVGVAIADLKGQIVKANPQLETMLGYGPGELASANLDALTFSEDVSVKCQACGVFLKQCEAGYKVPPGGRCEFEKRLLRRDGTVIWTHIVVSLIRAEDGAARFSIHLVSDITERRRMEQQLSQAEKMEVVGRLAAGFAHDFNNLLTLINGYSHLLLERISPRDPSRNELNEIVTAGNRATILTKRLLAFSRNQVPQHTVLDLNELIVGLEHTLRYFIGETIRLTLRLSGDAVFVEADRIQLELVITNLAINARDAMPDGGELHIETGVEEWDEEAAGVLGVPAGEYSRLSIIDTGYGMDAATKAQIFNPFFTTKAVGKGTGMGLWMAREIIEKGRGTIVVDSEPGRGARFRIYLPRLANDAEAALTSQPSAVPAEEIASGGSETILLAETDEMVREFTQTILTQAGYRVLPAGTGSAAIAAAQNETGEIDLLIVNANMRDMRGGALVFRIETTRPAIRVLFCSGNTDQFREEDYRREGSATLSKPYSRESLLRSVRDVFSSDTKPIIVIADDDPAIRTFLTYILEPEGYRIREAANGRQAIEQLRLGNVDLFITDLVMPDQEGIETIVAARKEFPHLPVIAMSGGFGEQFLSIARTLGAKQILHKPFRADAILETVRRLLAER